MFREIDIGPALAEHKNLPEYNEGHIGPLKKGWLKPNKFKLKRRNRRTREDRKILVQKGNTLI